MNQLEVVFCGDSLYLSGLAACLRRDPRLRVTQLDVPPAAALGDLRLLAPDAVVAEDAGEDAVAALLRVNPRLVFILVDAATDTLAVLAGHQPTAAPVAALASIILAGGHAPAPKGACHE